jgi:hypothetical protein
MFLDWVGVRGRGIIKPSLVKLSVHGFEVIKPAYGRLYKWQEFGPP